MKRTKISTSTDSAHTKRENTAGYTKTRALAESAILIALAFILSWIRLWRMPQSGSVTAVSMLPLIIIGIRHGPYWGTGSGIVYGLLQLLQGGGLFSPAQTLGSYTLEFVLDYLVAFGVMGLSFLFRRKKNGLLIAVPVCIALRFLCHLVSGVVVWYPYAPEGQNIWLYSAVYNGSYLAVEIVITAIVAFALLRVAPLRKLLRAGARK